MVKKLFVFLLLFSSYFTYAETIKTDVLVIGNGASAVTAAMQSARSKVKTILIVKGSWLENMPAENMTTIYANNNLPAGIWGEFRKHVQDLYKTMPRYDTTRNAPLKFELATGAAILKKMADTVKNLTIKLNTPFTTIKKDGTGWEVSITENGRTDYIKAKVLVDATGNDDALSKAGLNIKSPANILQQGGNMYRTAIACGDFLPGKKINKENSPKDNYPTLPAYCFPMSAMIINDADNYLVTEPFEINDLQYLPLQMNLGQGVATMAAYCAFFKTTTKNLKVRAIQGELLDFKGYVLPFEDVSPTDPYFRAIQQIGATGLLKGSEVLDNNGTKFLFMPDSVVTTAEIKPVLTEIYSRAFIWFNKAKPAEQFTVGNLLSLISEITLSEPKLFQTTIQKEWKTKYKFSSGFNVNHPVTRREFAILANQFLNPFARAVDLSGRIVN